MDLVHFSQPLSLSLVAGALQIKTSKIIMKTIAILALTAAALVSCQQHTQPVEPSPAPVVPLKK